MELNELTNIANRENIKVINYKMNNNKARIINYEGIYMFFDYSNINTYAEEKCLLAEELGHYYYDAYYSLSSDKEYIDKQEYKANKWKALACVPLQSLLSCFNSGICNFMEVAEKLQVTPSTLQFAYNYYINNNLLKTNA